MSRAAARTGILMEKEKKKYNKYRIEGLIKRINKSKFNKT